MNSATLTEDERDGPLLRYGNFIFRHRNLVFPLVLISLMVVFQPVFVFNDAGMDIVFDIIGLAIGFAGVVLRAAVVGIAYIKRGGINKRVAADRLVTEGMFAHNRNPLYIGNLLIVLGILLIANNLWLYLLGGSFFLVSYSAMVEAEERFLKGRFPVEYEDYCRVVPRWRFNFRGLWATLTGKPINWRRIVVKEYSSIGLWLVMNFAVFGYQEFANEPFAHSQFEIAAAAVGVVATGLMVLLLRALKKSGWFTPNSD